MKMRSNGRASLAAALVFALAAAEAGCASLEVGTTWTNPSAKGARLSKVAVICLAKDPGLRRIAENTAAANMTGARVIPSFEVLGDTDPLNREAVQKQLTSQGFQGVLVISLLGSVNQRVTPVGGPYGSDWDGNIVYDPGYLQTDTIVHVISNLYSLQDQKLIWSGVSGTFDAASATSFMNDVSKAVAKSLEEDHLII